MKTVQELKSAKSSWDVVSNFIKEATNKYEILPKNDKQADDALHSLQQSVSSLMGAVTYETGGIMIDNGWIRILGSGHPKLTRTITEWNMGRSYDETDETPGFLMVADDVVGGIFAINGNALGDDAGGLYYLAPDTVEWEPLEVTYEGFLEFCFKGQVSEFYSHFRWENWESDMKGLTGDQAFMVNPPFWSDETDEDIEMTRTVIGMDEMFDVLVEASELLDIESGFDEDGGCCGEEGCGCGDSDDDDEGGCCGEEGCGCGDNDNEDDGCCGEEGCGCGSKDGKGR